MAGRRLELVRGQPLRIRIVLESLNSDRKDCPVKIRPRGIATICRRFQH